MTYQIANILYVVPIQHSWQDEKVVHSLLSNFFELIGHAICVLLDDSHEICLCLNSVCTWLGDSSISMGFVNSFGMRYSLILMVCQSTDAMNYVPSVLTNLVETKSNELLSSLKKFV